jgi:NhaP-type Na+/H+ or K+/H+ antiporter
VDILLGIAGLLALAAAILPKLVNERPFSMPLAMLLAGLLLGLLPLPPPYGGSWGDPAAHRPEVELFAQVGILVALAGTGLSVDRALSRRGWRSTWRLLWLAMPLSIAAVALLGSWWLALGPAVALLLGAALAPTDPVLAGDVGVPAPDSEPDLAGDNEVRFTLTSEAGLNDGLAMPFVLLALALCTGRPPIDVTWVLTGLLLPVALGVVIGVVTGRLLGWAMFRAPADRLRLAEYTDGLVLLAIAFLPYALSELCHGNGFVAVFIAAVTVRSRERSHDYHAVLHTFGKQLERLFVSLALLGLGLALGDGLLHGLRLAEILLAVVAVLVVRPIIAALSLLGSPAGRHARRTIAFFGVRGIGTIYYLAYAAGKAPLPAQDTLWRVGALAIGISVLVHGIAADPVMRWIERRGEHTPQPSKPGR